MSSASSSAGSAAGEEVGEVDVEAGQVQDVDVKVEDVEIEEPPQAAPRLTGTVSELPVRRSQAADVVRVERHNSDPITSSERHQAARVQAGNNGRFAWERLQIPTPWGLVRLPSVREEFFCHVCYENCDVANMFSFTGNGGCIHKFCKDCLRMYVSVRIVDGQVRHPCPMIGEDSCEAEAASDDIRTLVDDEMFGKYDRFVKLKADENYRDCPTCGELVLGNRRRPAITCPKCTAQFCFFHSNAHPGESCRQFARRVRVEERASGLTIHQIAKKCPNCKLPTEKNGGCNHMTCYHCGVDWCWLCSRRMGNNHFEPWNILGCPGVQMMEGWNGEGLWIFRLLYVPLVLIAGALAIAFGIPLGILSAPFIWGCAEDCNPDDPFEKILIVTAVPVCIIMGCVLIGITCVWTAIALPICCVLSPLIIYRIRSGTFGWHDAARWLFLPSYVFMKQLVT